jgi:hypothetical protein
MYLNTVQIRTHSLPTITTRAVFAEKSVIYQINNCKFAPIRAI